MLEFLAELSTDRPASQGESSDRLDLPVEVKGGCMGKISIDIHRTSLYYEPVLVHVEEVLVLAGPIVDRKYDPEKEKRLCRALRSRRLEDAQPPDPDGPGDRPRGFMENLATTILNNVQLTMNSHNGHPSFPEDVGIIDIEIYFPSYYADQEELEVDDNISKGKYTIGLGQNRMSFCSDREDINSLCLTVVEQLMQKRGLSYSQIGRLEVGTETIIESQKV